MPGVKRGYENPIVEQAAQRTSQEAGMLTLRSPTDLPPGLMQNFVTKYLAELTQRADGANVFSNTHPGRIADVGAIASAVPNSRFIFVVRDKHDTALRIFMKHYREGGNVYAYQIQTVLDEILWYHELISAWQKRLPEVCRTVQYEDLVQNPSLIGAVVSELCELPDSRNSILSIPDDRGCSVPYKQYFTG